MSNNLAGASPADRVVRPGADALHAAACQAVALMNRSPEVARCADGREAHRLLRQALVDYGDSQPCAVPDGRCQSARECQELGACNPRLARDERAHAVLRRLGDAVKVAGPGLNQGVLLEQAQTLIKKALEAEAIVDDILCRMNEAPGHHIRESWKAEIRRAIVALRA